MDASDRLSEALERSQRSFHASDREEALGFEPTNPGIASRGFTGRILDGRRQDRFGQAGPRHRVRITGHSRSEGASLRRSREAPHEPKPDAVGARRGRSAGVNVSWDETQEFLRRLDGMEPYALHRLPTEAEWGSLPRGNESDRWSATKRAIELRDPADPPRRANAWGLYDLGGTTTSGARTGTGRSTTGFLPSRTRPDPQRIEEGVKGGNFGSDSAVSGRHIGLVLADHRSSPWGSASSGCHGDPSGCPDTGSVTAS